MQNSQVSNLAERVDETTRARCGALAARGLTDQQIADILLLTYDQVVAVRDTAEFKNKYAAEADRAIQDQIDRDEGWDALESLALENLLSTMKFNRDPKFSLLAAKFANNAERRARNTGPAKVIGSGEEGKTTTTNVVFLQLNKVYATQENNTIDVNARPKQIPLKQSDIPAPKLVDEILAPAKQEAGFVKRGKVSVDDVEQMAKNMGVIFDNGD